MVKIGARGRAIREIEFFRADPAIDRPGGPGIPNCGARAGPLEALNVLASSNWITLRGARPN